MNVPRRLPKDKYGVGGNGKVGRTGTWSAKKGSRNRGRMGESAKNKREDRLVDFKEV